MTARTDTDELLARIRAALDAHDQTAALVLVTETLFPRVPWWRRWIQRLVLPPVRKRRG